MPRKLATLLLGALALAGASGIGWVAGTRHARGRETDGSREPPADAPACACAGEAAESSLARRLDRCEQELAASSASAASTAEPGSAQPEPEASSLDLAAADDAPPERAPDRRWHGTQPTDPGQLSNAMRQFVQDEYDE